MHIRLLLLLAMGQPPSKGPLFARTAPLQGRRQQAAQHRDPRHGPYRVNEAPGAAEPNVGELQTLDPEHTPREVARERSYEEAVVHDIAVDDAKQGDGPGEGWRVRLYVREMAVPLHLGVALPSRRRRSC